MCSYWLILATGFSLQYRTLERAQALPATTALQPYNMRVQRHLRSRGDALVFGMALTGSLVSSRSTSSYVSSQITQVPHAMNESRDRRPVYQSLHDLEDAFVGRAEAGDVGRQFRVQV